MDNDPVLTALRDALNEVREHKPNDKSEEDRRFAVTITEMEKVIAYYLTYVVNG
jgi:hypothetical protein